MAQKKDKNGLTPQQEKFCQEVVRAEYSSDGSGVLITAYRKAYNCKSEGEKPTKTQYENASRLWNDSKIRARIKEIEEEHRKALTLSHAEFVSNDIWLNDLDVLDLMKYDESIGAWRMRRVYEMPKEIRKRVPFKIDNKGRMIPDLDKEAIRDRLVKVLGFADEKSDVNVNIQNGRKIITFGGFDDDLWGENEPRN